MANFSYDALDNSGESESGYLIADSVEEAKNELSNLGIEVVIESEELAKVRCVEELLSFDDPAGNTLELFHGRGIDINEFKSSQDI